MKCLQELMFYFSCEHSIFQNDPHHFILFSSCMISCGYSSNTHQISQEDNKNQFFSIVALYVKLMLLEQHVAKINTPQLHSSVAYLGTPHSLGFILHITT
jgi:hypothetical protein